MKTPFPAMKCLQKVLKSRIKKCLRHRVKVNCKNFDRGDGTSTTPIFILKGKKKGVWHQPVPIISRRAKLANSTYLPDSQ